MADAEGNDAGRLTYGSDARTRVTGWTGAGEVLAVSATGQPETYLTWAYAVPLEGSPPRRLPFGPVVDLALEETGTALLTGRGNNELAYWKRYRGGTRGRLWTATSAGPPVHPGVASLRDFAAFALIARNDFNRPLPAFVHPKLPLAARLGLCWGARPSRLPFSAPRQSPFAPACLGLRGQAQRDPAFARTEIYRITDISRPPESAVAAPLCRRTPNSSTPNCHWPVLAHGHQRGLCRGARPSRLPFSASRPSPSSRDKNSTAHFPRSSTPNRLWPALAHGKSHAKSFYPSEIMVNGGDRNGRDNLSIAGR